MARKTDIFASKFVVIGKKLLFIEGVVGIFGEIAHITVMFDGYHRLF